MSRKIFKQSDKWRKVRHGANKGIWGQGVDSSVSNQEKDTKFIPRVSDGLSESSAQADQGYADNCSQQMRHRFFTFYSFFKTFQVNVNDGICYISPFYFNKVKWSILYLP